MLQEKLREITKKDHDGLEQLMFVSDIMSGQLSLDQYKQILLVNYLTHFYWEEQVLSALTDEISSRLFLAKRKKLAALTADMHEAGMVPPVDSQPAASSIFKSSAEALGGMYVMEGATLGGSVIVKKLKTNPNFGGLSFHYYQVYGEELGQRWKEFCTVLNDQPETTWPQAIDGAKKMFGKITTIAERTRSDVEI